MNLGTLVVDEQRLPIRELRFLDGKLHIHAAGVLDVAYRARRGDLVDMVVFGADGTHVLTHRGRAPGNCEAGRTLHVLFAIGFDGKISLQHRERLEQAARP